MSIAALSPGGPHVVRKIAFATPVREAGGAPHWVTLHAEDSDEGTCHILIGGNGAIQAGPKSLVGHHIAALASHPSVSKAQHHPVGHEPAGAREHPHYAEAVPTPPVAPGDAGKGEAIKRPGKPYARLHGAEQGTRAEQIGKALSEAQAAAKGAKAAQGQQPARGTYRALGSEAWSPETHAAVQGTQLTDAHRSFFREHPHILDAIRQSTSEGAFATKAPSLASSSSPRTRLTPEENARRFKDYQDVKALGFLHHERGVEPRIRGSLWTHGQKFLQEQHEAGKGEAPPEGARSATGFDNPVSATARMADKSAAAAEKSGGRLTDMGAAKEQLRAKVEAARAAKAARQRQDDVADTAVAHQQAQADLAAHRASADRNPNPWAPHLSPPVGDAKDRELAEKATRAQLAHQAAQAQQQGAQQAEQTEGQRAHEKEMVRLKAEQATEQSARAAGASASDARILANQVRAGHGLIRGKRPHNPEQATEDTPSSKPRPAHEHQPGDSGEIYKARNELQDAQRRWATAKVEARTPAEHKRVDLHQEMVRRLTNQVRDLAGKAKPAEAPKPAEPKKPAQAAYEALQAEVKRRQGDRPVEQTPRFSEPQTVPQPVQGAGAPAPKAEQTRFGQDAPAGPVQHKAATSGDPIQPARAKPVGQLGLFGEHKPLAEPKKRGSAAQQQMQAGQKSLLGSSFSNPHERTPAPDAAATQRRKSLEEAERAARSEAIAATTASRKNPARVEATGRAHDAAMAALAEHNRGGTPAPAPEVHDEGHVGQIMQVHARQDAAGRQAYQNQMARIATGESYRPTMPDGRPLGRATAAEAVRRMMRAGRPGVAR